MKNLNKFLIYRPKCTVNIAIGQTNRLFDDRTFQFLSGTVSTRYNLHYAVDYKSVCLDASVYIFSNLNLFLDISVRKVPCFSHCYNYTYHDYCITKNKFIKHYGKLK